MGWWRTSKILSNKLQFFLMKYIFTSQEIIKCYEGFEHYTKFVT